MITVKEFCAEYSKRTDKLKVDYLRDNLKVKSYLPFLTKDVLAQNVVNVSTYEYEDYTKEDGTPGRRKTDKIHVNSTAQMLLFYRLLIEHYTNLKIETEGFYEEYDALNESGILFELTADFEGHSSLIPVSEINDLKAMIEMKQRDIMTNYMNPQIYISNQIDKFKEIAEVMLEPLTDAIVDKLNEIDVSNIDLDAFKEIIK